MPIDPSDTALGRPSHPSLGTAHLTSKTKNIPTARCCSLPFIHKFEHSNNRMSITLVDPVKGKIEVNVYDLVFSPSSSSAQGVTIDQLKNTIPASYNLDVEKLPSTLGKYTVSAGKTGKYTADFTVGETLREVYPDSKSLVGEFMYNISDKHNRATAIERNISQVFDRTARPRSIGLVHIGDLVYSQFWVEGAGAIKALENLEILSTLVTYHIEEMHRELFASKPSELRQLSEVLLDHERLKRMIEDCERPMFLGEGMISHNKKEYEKPAQYRGTLLPDNVGLCLLNLAAVRTFMYELYVHIAYVKPKDLEKFLRNYEPDRKQFYKRVNKKW